jgi:hypothetical protein
MSSPTLALALDPRSTVLRLVDPQHGIFGRPIAPHPGAEVLATPDSFPGALVQ